MQGPTADGLNELVANAGFESNSQWMAATASYHPHDNHSDCDPYAPTPVAVDHLIDGNGDEPRRGQFRTERHQR